MGSSTDPSIGGLPKPPSKLDMEKTAFFFDFDGVLADIVDDPEKARVEPDILDHLKTLHDATAGALALISGREIRQLDAFVSPARYPAAGAHGAERRTGSGDVVRTEIDRAVLARLVSALDAFAAKHDGLIAERKDTSVALHYRRNPQMESESLALAEKLAAEHENVKLVRGKMVAELKLTDRDKGSAVADFMEEPPFRGRQAVFAGDDVTDEDGFKAVRSLGGIAIKVGDGETVANTRVADIDAFHDWLGDIVKNAGH